MLNREAAMTVDRLESLADMSVARGCGFAGLAIVCAMVGFAFDPVFAFKAGGALCLAMTGTLLVKAWRAPWTSHKRTEIWALLDKTERPPADAAQWLIAAVRRRACLKWADISARFAVGLLCGAIALSLLAAA
jgi:hypothetical protein